MERIAHDFQRAPYDFLYESDLRSALHSLLRTELGALRNRLSSSSAARFGIAGDAFTTSVVRTEYPSGKRFDVAIVGHDDDRSLWMQPVEVGIEIKLWQVDRSGHGISKDVAKLEAERIEAGGRFRGISLVFAHSTELAKMKLKRFQLDWLWDHYSDVCCDGAQLTTHLVTPDLHLWIDLSGSENEIRRKIVGN